MLSVMGDRLGSYVPRGRASGFIVVGVGEGGGSFQPDARVVSKIDTLETKMAARFSRRLI